MDFKICDHVKSSLSKTEGHYDPTDMCDLWRCFHNFLSNEIDLDIFDMQHDCDTLLSIATKTQCYNRDLLVMHFNGASYSGKTYAVNEFLKLVQNMEDVNIVYMSSTVIERIESTKKVIFVINFEDIHKKSTNEDVKFIRNSIHNNIVNNMNNAYMIIFDECTPFCQKEFYNIDFSHCRVHEIVPNFTDLKKNNNTSIESIKKYIMISMCHSISNIKEYKVLEYEKAKNKFIFSLHMLYKNIYSKKEIETIYNSTIPNKTQFLNIIRNTWKALILYPTYDFTNKIIDNLFFKIYGFDQDNQFETLELESYPDIKLLEYIDRDNEVHLPSDEDMDEDGELFKLCRDIET